jgi:hypothetical protein
VAISEFQEASRAHVKRLAHLTDKNALPALRKLYAEAQADLERKLAKAVSSKASAMTIQQHQALLAQVRQGVMQMSSSLGAKLGAATVQTQNAALNALIKDIKKLEKKSTGSIMQLPIETAARFAGVVDKHKTSLLKLNATSMAKYGAGMVGKMEGALAQTLMQGESGFRAIDRITEVYDMEWWKAERVVRTEQAWAYNATQVDGVKAATETLPDMMVRWVEFVEDVTLRKLDDRVGDDSVAMHGQIAKPGGLFYMPPTPPPGLKISQSLVGMSWSNPPNRPNDRSVVQPWRPGWGWAWELVNGQRVFR